MSYSGPIMEPASLRQRTMGRSMQVVKSGVSFGSALAIAISWSVHHSIIWAICQGFLGWIYVVYYALTR
ncbi:MAG: hypothetical protein ABI625_16535 [bacterium]